MPNLDPEEDPEELVLVVHFYGIRSSGGLCAAALKKIIALAQEGDLAGIVHILESAYVDDCNGSLGTAQEITTLKQEMPIFMFKYGFPIKALACTGERALVELTDTTTINVAGYKWEPHTDIMMITIGIISTFYN